MRSLSELAAPDDFAIVGVGASAGGIEAFQTLLRHVPDTARLAFVFIQHRLLAESNDVVAKLSAATIKPIHRAQQGIRIEPGGIYLTEPGVDVAVRAGELVCSPALESAAGGPMPVDFFLRSLAAERGKRAIGVLLSGAESDGTDGLRAIRAAGGIALAQATCSARFAGMAQSAIDAAVVDYCLDLPELGTELIRLSFPPVVDSQQSIGRDAGERIARLEQDIAATREYLHVLVDAHARAVSERDRDAS